MANDNTPEVARNASQHVQSIFFITSPLVPRQDAVNLNFTNNYLEINHGNVNESTHSELHEKPDQGNFYVKEESMFNMLKNRNFSKKNSYFHILTNPDPTKINKNEPPNFKTTHDVDFTSPSSSSSQTAPNFLSMDIDDFSNNFVEKNQEEAHNETQNTIFPGNFFISEVSKC